MVHPSLHTSRGSKEDKGVNKLVNGSPKANKELISGDVFLNIKS